MANDAHIHLYPESVFSDLQSWAIKRGERHWLNCVAPSSGPTLQGWADVDRLISDMDNAGIERVAILGWYWENPDTCHENARWQIEWIKKHSDRLIAYAPFNAKGGTRSLETLEKAFDQGLRGVGELNPPAQGFDYDDPTLRAAIEMATERGLPINFHVTDPNSRDYPGKIETPFASLRDLAKDHPKATFVFAHLGGMMRLKELKRLPNVWVDTAAIPLMYPSIVYKKAIDSIGADRMLFGTDYPLRTFPRHQRQPDFSSHLESIANAGLSAEELHSILADNFNRIHALPGS